MIAVRLTTSAKASTTTSWLLLLCCRFRGGWLLRHPERRVLRAGFLRDVALDWIHAEPLRLDVDDALEHELLKRHPFLGVRALHGLVAVGHRLIEFAIGA